MRNFRDLIGQKWADGRFVCVGLDTDSRKLPDHLEGTTLERMLAFNVAIAMAVQDFVAAFKLNLWFYLGQGEDGLKALIQTCEVLRRHDIPIILDGKFGDVKDTEVQAARFAYEVCGADAVTLNPYMGLEPLEPFLSDTNKFGFVLCRTSNPGAPEFQDQITGDGDKLFVTVARETFAHSATKDRMNCGLVVGATYPDEMAILRMAVPELVFLIPGVGKQGGDVRQVVRNSGLMDRKGAIVNSSSATIYASNGRDFEEAAHKAAKNLNEEILTVIEE